MNTLKIQCHIEGMPVPERAHASDAGIDLTAMSVEQKRHNVYFFDTGISIQVSPGFYVEIVPRSSIVKTEFVMANSVGIIDSDYRGRIFIPFRYVGSGDPSGAVQELLNKRIAQMLVRKREECVIEVVSELDSTVRGSGGFGSTGA